LDFTLNDTLGKGLRIKSKSIGVSSTVRFDETSTAFDDIIGYSEQDALEITDWNNTYQYGYEYRDGTTNFSGFAIGHKDIDYNNTKVNVNLGTRLGDCSTVNKTLTVVIDGITYNVVFNENLTSQSNTYIIALINAVIGAVADTDEFSITKENYLTIPSLKNVVNSSSTVILEGMGVVYSGYNKVRPATNADNRIDGIALDDFGLNQVGRISSAYFYSLNQRTDFRYTLLEVNDTSRAFGTEMGISTTQDGYFDTTASPKLVRAYDSNKFKII